jgi:hypothetical protein
MYYRVMASRFQLERCHTARFTMIRHAQWTINPDRWRVLDQGKARSAHTAVCTEMHTALHWVKAGTKVALIGFLIRRC